jgi:sugar/nucleoside kinase (ribokinase family)
VALSHPDGERTFVSHLGHLAVSAPDALERAIDRADPGDLLFVGGSFLLPRWRPALHELLGRARARGLVTGLDTGWPTEGWTPAVRAEVRAVLAEVDVFLPNLAEAHGLLGVAPETSAAAALEALTAMVAGRVAIKLGPAGAAYLYRGTTAIAPAPDLGVADTVGAGDAFNAALLCGLRDHLAWPEAVELAVTAASHIIAASPRRYRTWSELRRTGPKVAAG